MAILPQFFKIDMQKFKSLGENKGIKFKKLNLNLKFSLIFMQLNSSAADPRGLAVVCTDYPDLRLNCPGLSMASPMLNSSELL